MPELIETLNEKSLKTGMHKLVRRTVEDTLSGLLEEKAGYLADAECYERTAEREACCAGRHVRDLSAPSDEATSRSPSSRA